MSDIALNTEKTFSNKDSVEIYETNDVISFGDESISVSFVEGDILLLYKNILTLQLTEEDFYKLVKYSNEAMDKLLWKKK